MNWVDGLLADSAEIIDQEGLLPKGYYEHVRLQDDRNCPFYYIIFYIILVKSIFNWGKSKEVYY